MTSGEIYVLFGAAGLFLSVILFLRKYRVSILRRDRQAQLKREPGGEDVQSKIQSDNEEMLLVFRAMADSANDAIIMMDDNGCIRQWNRAAELMFGYNSGEALGADLHTLIVPERYRSHFHKVFPDFVSTGKGSLIGKTFEVEGIRKDAAVIVTELSLSALAIHDRWYSVGILRDVTERKQADEQLARNNEELFEAKLLAEEQTQKLVTQSYELIQAREAAMEASRLKSEFVANMSHEIRTPMNGIISMSDLLLQTDLDEEQKEYADIIRSSGDALVTLINDILDYSRIEAGKLMIDSVEFDIRSTVEEVVSLLSRTATKKGIEFIADISPLLPSPVVGDPSRIRQIMLNLTGNAIKFTSTGEVSIVVTAEEDDGDYITVRFSVHDTGIGISPENQKKLFQAFTQADGSMTRKYGGTGLGLAISKQLVDLMLGSIGLESEMGKGSHFWFTTKLKKHPPPIPGPVLKFSNSFRVLVIESNRSAMICLENYIRSFGLRCIGALGPDEGITLFKKAIADGDQFALVFVDAHLPGDGAKHLLEDFASMENSTPVRCVIATHLGTSAASLARSADAVVQKPVRLGALFHAIEAALKSTRRGVHKKEKVRAAVHGISVEKIKVLVAEDNAINQTVAKRMLEKINCTVTIAESGLAVLQYLEEEKFDLILMDCQMPDLDGYETTERIRQKEGEDKHSVIIAMTANAFQGDREKCLECGMDDYVSKPVKQSELQAIVERWVSR